MNRIALALGAAIATVATTAFAQVYYQRPYDPYWNSRNAGDECWNPRDERWEVLRPGEIQDNLDRNQCRAYRGP